jgi:hypothetical protein
VHSYGASSIMKVKEMRVAHDVSHFIMKVGVSPITKADASPFIMKADTSLIPYRER